MRNLVRYFGLTFLQYMGVVVAFVALEVLGARYTPFSIFETYLYLLPTMGLWLAPMTLTGSHATMILPNYFGVCRRKTFLCFQVLAVLMELCTLALGVLGSHLVTDAKPEYDIMLTPEALPVLLMASLTISELAFLSQHLPRGGKQRTTAVLMVLIMLVFIFCMTFGVFQVAGFPLPLFPLSVLRPGWTIFTLVCAAAAVMLGVFSWRCYRKAVIRL